MKQTFGQVIRQARKDKGYTQRQVAKMLKIDFTYLSKLENDRADYPAKEDVIRSLAQKLDRNEEELIFLAGRTPASYEEFIKQHYRELPVLFRRMADNPEFAEQMFRAAVFQADLGEWKETQPPGVNPT